MNLMTVDVDEAQLYMGEDYPLNAYIAIRQPSIGEIVSFGESHYFSVVHTLCAIPSDKKSFLYDNGIDYEKISNYELFLILTRNLTVEDTCLIFGNLDLSKMIVCDSLESGGKVLVDPETLVTLDEFAYTRMFNYLCKAHRIIPKVEYGSNEFTKRFLIDEDRQKILKAKEKKEEYKSMLVPLMSAMINSAGFKYNKEQLKNVQIYEFMDSVDRIRAIMTATAALNGAFGGMLDTSKMKDRDKKFNWLRRLDEHDPIENKTVIKNKNSIE